MRVSLSIQGLTHRSLHQSRARNSHGFDRLEHINDLLDLKTFKHRVQRTKRSTAAKTVAIKHRNTQKSNYLKKSKQQLSNVRCLVVRPMSASETRVVLLSYKPCHF